MYASSSEGTIEDKPLELGVYQYQSSKEAIMKVWGDLAEKKGRITIGDCLMVTAMAILNQFLYLFYITIYFYYGAFFPFLMVLLCANQFRHTPCTNDHDTRNP